MSTLYVTQQDAVLRKEDERLKVTHKGEKLLDLPMLKVSQVVVMGRVTVTPYTVAALMERNVCLRNMATISDALNPLFQRIQCFAGRNTRQRSMQNTP